jgi:hypothetical protein
MLALGGEVDEGRNDLLAVFAHAISTRPFGAF